MASILTTSLAAIGILSCPALLFAQSESFTFDFSANNQTGVYTFSDGGEAIMSDWETNPFDEIATSAEFLFAFGEPEDRSGFQIESNGNLNWVGSGLGVESGGRLNALEFVTFSFDQDVRIDEVVFANFSFGTTATSRDIADITLGGEATFSFGDDSGDGSVWLSGGVLFAGDSLQVAHSNGSFNIASMTISAVPEASTLILSGASAFFALGLGFVKRRKSQSD